MGQQEPPRAPGADHSPKPPFLTTFIATGFYSGYLPWAPGTWGSLAGLLIAAIPGADSPVVLSVMIIAGFAAGIHTSARVAEHVGNELSRRAEVFKGIFQPGDHPTPDPSIVVIDEIVGMWISLLLVPKSPLNFLLAFLAFRGFDILKPFPGRQLERLSHGWGIMLDDVVAGVYANIAAHLVILGLSAIGLGRS